MIAAVMTRCGRADTESRGRMRWEISTRLVREREMEASRLAREQGKEGGNSTSEARPLLREVISVTWGRSDCKQGRLFAAG